MAAIDKERPVRLTIPEEFEDEAAFLNYARRIYQLDVEADKHNRDETKEDFRFVAGYQWDDETYNYRLNQGKPALTINTLPTFVAGWVGNTRLNQTVINVIPDKDKDKAEAQVRKEIVRGIQRASKAKRAYNCARQNQFIGGLGNYRIVLDYTSDDVFEQDIMISAIENPDAVVWDRLSVDPTGADARHVFVTDRMDIEDFRKRWPKAATSSFQSGSTMYAQLESEGWIDRDTVRIASFCRMGSERRTIALMQNGEVNDVTDLPVEQYIGDVVVRRDGTPVMREIDKPYSEEFLLAGGDVLEGPYRLPIRRVPVIRVPGWEINVGDKRERFGAIRFTRDPSRLRNYWRSIIAEKLMMAPNARWLAGKSAVSGYEKAFRDAHLTDDPLLIYDDEEGTKPELIPPVQMEAALLNEAGIAAQDISNILNMHEAAREKLNSDVSGQAILAWQRIGELGTVIYDDNFNMSLEEAGRVINDLIPFVYDTPRVLKVAGDTPEEVQFIAVNFDSADDPNSIDITSGKYNITSTTGPSFETKRIEARESMMGAINAMPDSFSAVADIVAEAQDWPLADKMAQRIRNTMPPQVLGQDLTPEQQAAQQAQAQKVEMAEKIAIMKDQAEISERQMRALKARAEAILIMAKSGLERERAEAEIEKIYAEIESQDIRDTLQTIDAITGENNVSD